MTDDVCFLCHGEALDDAAVTWRCAAPHCSSRLHREPCLLQYTRAMATQGQRPPKCPHEHAMPVRLRRTWRWAEGASWRSLAVMALVRVALADLVRRERSPWAMVVVAVCLAARPAALRQPLAMPWSWIELAAFGLGYCVAPWIAPWRWFPFILALFYGARVRHMPDAVSAVMLFFTTCLVAGAWAVHDLLPPAVLRTALWMDLVGVPMARDALVYYYVPDYVVHVTAPP